MEPLKAADAEAVGTRPMRFPVLCFREESLRIIFSTLKGVLLLVHFCVTKNSVDVTTCGFPSLKCLYPQTADQAKGKETFRIPERFVKDEITL